MTLDPLESEWTAGLSTALVDSKLADAMRDLLGAKGGRASGKFASKTSSEGNVAAPIAGAGLPGLTLARVACSAGGDGGGRSTELTTRGPPRK